MLCYRSLYSTDVFFSSKHSHHISLILSVNTDQEEEDAEEGEQREAEQSITGSERQRRESVYQAWSVLTNNLPDLTKATLGAKR